MQLLPPGAYERVLPLMQTLPFNTLFARAVVEQKVAGSVWVDAPESPQLADIRHPYGMWLLAGHFGRIGPAALARHYLATRPPTDAWLQVGDAALAAAFESTLGVVPGNLAGGACGLRPQRYTRVNFAFKGSTPKLDSRELVSTRPLLAEEFHFPALSVAPQHFWRHAHQFHAHGGGWCVDRGAGPESIAFASFRFDDCLEIGIETCATARRQGLARLAASMLIAECGMNGLEPVWSCRKENQASYRLACALGFEPVRELPYYRLPGKAALP